MSKISLTMDIVQELDVKGGRLLAIIKDRTYRDLIAEYELDLTQSLLWYDVVQVINAIMDIYEYEDIEISRECLGKVVKKILQQKDAKFPFLKAMVDQTDDDEYVGTIVWEMVEDLENIYDSIQKDMKKILTTQRDIDRIVEENQ